MRGVALKGRGRGGAEGGADMVNTGVLRPVCARRRCCWWRCDSSAVDLSVRPECTRLPLVVVVRRVVGAEAHGH